MKERELQGLLCQVAGLGFCLLFPKAGRSEEAEKYAMEIDMKLKDMGF